MPEVLVLILALRNGFTIPSPIDTWFASRYPICQPRYGTESPRRLLSGGLCARGVRAKINPWIASRERRGVSRRSVTFGIEPVTALRQPDAKVLRHRDRAA